MPLKIGIIVGELSGDILGAGLLKELHKIYPNIEIEGVVGPNLIEGTATQLYPMEELSFIGFLEPLLNIRKLLKMRKWLIRYFTEEPPDLFIGIDAPEFNLGIERKLKEHGIPIVHYVSPQVWAWRSYRIKKIKKSIDLMLTLFPFEEKFYKKHDVPVKFVGHPTADKIPENIDNTTAKSNLNIPRNKTVVALLPGSRKSEIKKHTLLYLQTASNCLKQNSNFIFITSLVKDEHVKYFESIKQKHAIDLPIMIFTNKSHEVMAASDLVLVASGTATLEVMLHKKPMVVAYKTNFLTYWLVKMLIKVPYISLPNLLADKKIVPELIQKEATVKNLTEKLMDLFNNYNSKKEQLDVFDNLCPMLRQNASKVAANAIKDLLDTCQIKE